MKETKKKILIADDDLGVVDAVKMILEEVGYDVQTADDEDTILAVKRYHPDVILLDIWMSGIDGREICKQLKLRKETKHFPIIMISANKDTERIAKEIGADDFISKPFQMEDLLEKVAKHISTGI